MNLINLPMAESLTLKKMTDQGKGKDDSGNGSKRLVAHALGELGLGAKKLKTGVSSSDTSAHHAGGTPDEQMGDEDGFSGASARA